MASSFPQILPMWWVMIFSVILIILFSLISSISEGVMIPSRSFSTQSKKTSSWLK